nr:MAG TPA: hypothetical protein [Caudoviricetes sp.]
MLSQNCKIIDLSPLFLATYILLCTTIFNRLKSIICEYSC